jgi:hypothetical protein
MSTARMGEALTMNRRAMPHPFFGTRHFLLDMLHRKTLHIVQPDLCEQIPDFFLQEHNEHNVLYFFVVDIVRETFLPRCQSFRSRRVAFVACVKERGRVTEAASPQRSLASGRDFWGLRSGA